MAASGNTESLSYEPVAGAKVRRPARIDAPSKAEEPVDVDNAAREKLRQSAVFAPSDLPLPTKPSQSAYLEMSDPFKPVFPNAQPNAQHEPVLAKAPQTSEQPTSSPGWFNSTVNWVEGAADVATQVAEGAAVDLYKEVRDNPGHAALTVVGGVVAGVALIAAAPILAAAGASAAVASGVVMAADVAVVGLTAVGAIGATEAATTACANSADSASVLMDKSHHTAAEIAAAREDVQAKTGTAALEVVGATVGLVGGVASGMRLVSTVSGALKSSEPLIKILSGNPFKRVATTGSDLAPTKSASPALTRPADLPAAPNIQPPQQSPVVEASAPGGKLESSPGRRVEKGDSTNNRDLPAGSIEKLSERLDEMIVARQSKFDVRAAESRVDKLQEGERKFRFKLMTEPKLDHEFFSAGDLADADFMKSQLRDIPDLSKQYEQYRVDMLARKSLQGQVADEMNIRRQAVAQIVKEEAGHLFPTSKLPTFRVAELDAASKYNATYANGIISIKNENLTEICPLTRTLTGNTLPGRLAHEMKHGEQDVLLLRRYIDDVTGGDTTSRSLTADESSAVRDKFKAAIGRTLPPEMITEANVLRNGDVLTSDELTRAEQIETSKAYVKKEAGLLKAARQRLQDLNYELDEQSTNPSSYILEFPERLRHLFGEPLPQAIEELQTEALKLPRNEDGDWVTDINFEARASDVLSDELETAIAQARQTVETEYAKYRGWAHEQESWDIGQEADSRVGGAGKSSDELISLFKKIFTTDGPELSDIQNDMNKDAFIAFDEARANASGTDKLVYAHVLSDIADEEGSLKDPAILEDFIARLTEGNVEQLLPEEQSVYDDIAALLRRTGENRT